MLGIPLNTRILYAVVDGAERQMDVRRTAGSPAQSTLRARLRELQARDTLVKRRRNGFPGTLEYELTKPGRELLSVASVLERWLARAPGGSLELGGDSARAAIKALVDGWSSSMLRALAAGPLTLTDLDSLIAGFNYPSLERRLSAMRLAGLVEAAPGDRRGTPYRVTEWLRRGMGPIMAAARWEHCHMPQEAPRIGRTDVEAALMLTVPLLRLSAEPAGSCRLVVELANGDPPKLAAVTVTVEDGRVVSCTSRGGEASAWATGSAGAWFGAALEADPDYLELGGDRQFVRCILDGLYKALGGAKQHDATARPSAFIEIEP